VPGLGLISRGIAAVAAHPDTKMAVPGVIATPHAVSNQPKGVDGGSVFARHLRTRFGEKAVIHPSWN
jgi:hypothetical protein